MVLRKISHCLRGNDCENSLKSPLSCQYPDRHQMDGAPPSVSKLPEKYRMDARPRGILLASNGNPSLGLESADPEGGDKSSFAPCLKLPQNLVQRFLNKKLSPEKLRAFYENLDVYQIRPETGEEIGLLTDNSVIVLLQSAGVRDFFNFLKERFGFSFSADFVRFVREITSYDVHLMQIEMASLASLVSMFGGEGDEKDKHIKELQNFVGLSLAEFRRKITMADEEILSGLKKRCGGEFSMDAFLIYVEGLEKEGEAFRKKVAAFSFDQEKFKKVSGGKYQKDVLLMALAAVFQPDFMDRMERVEADLKPEDGKIGKEVIAFVSGYKSDSAIHHFVDWLSKYFEMTFSLSQIVVLSWTLPELEKAGGGGLFTEATAKQVAAFLKKFDLPFGPHKLLGYLWSEEAMEMYQKFADSYGIAPMNTGTVGEYRQEFHDKKSVLYHPQAFDADVVVVAKGITARDLSNGTGPSFFSVAEAIRLALHFEKEMPGSSSFLAKLTASGVKIETTDLNFGKERMAALLRLLMENPKLLEDIRIFLARIPALRGKMTPLELTSFVSLSETMREQMINEKNAELLNLLSESYDWDLNYTSVAEVVREGGFLEQYGHCLTDEKLKQFYSQNRELFKDRGKKEAKLSMFELPGVLALYFETQKKPKILEMARLRQRYLGGRLFSEMVAVLKEDRDGKVSALLYNPRLPEVPDVLKKMGFETDEIFQTTAEELLAHIDVLKSRDFQDFYREMTTVYNFERKDYRLVDALGVFRGEKLRAFLSDDGARQFIEELGALGYKPEWGKIAELKRMYDAKDFLGWLKKLAGTYRLNLKDIIRRAVKKTENPFLFFANGFRTPKDYNFFEDFLALVESGDIAILVSEKAKGVYAFLNGKLKYSFDPFDMSSLVVLLKSETILKEIVNDDFVQFLRNFSGAIGRGSRLIRFDVDYLDVFRDLAKEKEAVFRVTAGLKEAYNFVPKSMEDITNIRDLAMNLPAFSDLTGEKCRKIVSILVEKHKYTFELKDVWGLLYLAGHEGEIERLYAGDVEEFSLRVLGEKPGTDIAGRLKIARLLASASPEEKAFYLSDDLKRVRERLAALFSGGSFPVQTPDLPNMFVIHKNPEILPFLQKIEFGKHFSMFDPEPVVDFMPAVLRLAKDPRAAQLIRDLRAIQGKYPKAYYRFHMADAVALAKLLGRYSVEEIVKMAKQLAENFQNRITANDIYCYAERKNSFSFDRTLLEKAVREGFAGDIHRMDSNFDSYDSYNDPSKLTIVGLNKVVELKNWLGKSEARKALGDIIRRDVEEYPSSELGGTILLDGALTIMEGEPMTNFQNGSYQASNEIKTEYSASIAQYHLHATVYDDKLKAGPSGSRLIHGGDVDFARVFQTDGIVITAMGKGRFCVHFYDKNKNVIFLGSYEIPQ